MTQQNVLTDSKRKEILDSFCARIQAGVICYGEHTNRKKLSHTISDDKASTYFVAMLESGHITLKETNGSSTNLKVLFRDKTKLLGVISISSN